MNEIQYVRQHDSMECGISCLSMVCKIFDKEYNTSKLYKICKATKEGVSLKAIAETAHSIGLDTVSVQITLEELISHELCTILHWNQNHFVVLYKVKKGKIFYIADPAKGLVKYNVEEFKKHWISTHLADTPWTTDAHGEPHRHRLYPPLAAAPHLAGERWS